jgi:hypothetical protein
MKQQAIKKPKKAITKKVKIPIIVKQPTGKTKTKPEFCLDKELNEVVTGVTRILEALKNIPIFIITCLKDGEYDITEVEYIPDSRDDTLKMFNDIGQEVHRRFAERGIKGLVLAANVSFVGPFPNSNRVTLKPEAERKALNPKTAVLFVAKDENGLEKHLAKTYEMSKEHGVELITFKPQDNIAITPELAATNNSFALMNELWIGYKFQSIVAGTNLKLLTNK